MIEKFSTVNFYQYGLINEMYNDEMSITLPPKILNEYL